MRMRRGGDARSALVGGSGPRRIVPWRAASLSINRFFAFLREFGHATRHRLPLSMQQESALSHSTKSAPTAPEIAACLAQGNDVWIFGYGSLMWDPGFAFIEARPALLRGYHRSFCVYSHGHRGTPERPGLVLGLDRGGACKGIAYCVPPADAPQALHYLWEREMTNRTYHMREVALATPDGALAARTFIVDRQHRNYAGRLSLEETARLILQGIGKRGPCRQYLENTVAELRKLGHLDGPMHRLEEMVKALAAAASPCAS